MGSTLKYNYIKWLITLTRDSINRISLYQLSLCYNSISFMELSSFYSFFNPFGCNLDKYDDLYLTILLSISPDLPKNVPRNHWKRTSKYEHFFLLSKLPYFSLEKNFNFQSKVKKNQFHILIKNLQDFFFVCVRL